MTQRVGALDEQFLGRGRPLGEARVLWEIGADGAEVRELRQRLGMDSGYASRLLRSLEAQGLVEVETAAGDRRVRRARLTRGRPRRARGARPARGRAGGVDPRAARRAPARASSSPRWRTSSGSCSPRAITIGVEDAAQRRCALVHPAVLDGARGSLRARLRSGAEHPVEVEDLPRRRAPARRAPGRPPVGCGGLRFHADAPPT